MIQHIVMWKKTPDTDSIEYEALKDEIRTKFNKLTSVIPQLRSISCDVAITGSPAGNFDLCLICNFDAFADLEIYQYHPAHLEIVAIIKSLHLQRACIDFEY